MPSRYPARARSHGARKIDTREPRQRFLVVCEGKRTEPDYFRAFRVSGLDLRVIGAGDNTRNLVTIADEARQEGEYDQVWIVLDRDDFPTDRFNAAIQMARSRQIQVAYSNKAFELWYVLHFAYLESGLTVSQYEDILSRHLGRTYRKSDRHMFDVLFPVQERAMRNATRLAASYRHLRPAESDPSTSVHLLVAELRKFSR